MDIKDKSIAEYNSTFLQRHFKKVLQRCINDGVIVITSGDVKFYVLNEETFKEFIVKAGLKIEG